MKPRLRHRDEIASTGGPGGPPPRMENRDVTEISRNWGNFLQRLRCREMTASHRPFIINFGDWDIKSSSRHREAPVV